LRLQRGEGAANLIERVPRSVPVTPRIDVIPIDPVSLHGDHVARVIPILTPASDCRPTHFRNDNVLHRGKHGLTAPKRFSLTAAKAFLIVWVVGEMKEFDVKVDTGDFKSVLVGHGDHLELHLRVETKEGAKAVSQFADRTSAKLDDQISI